MKALRSLVSTNLQLNCCLIQVLRRWNELKPTTLMDPPTRDFKANFTIEWT